MPASCYLLGRRRAPGREVRPASTVCFEAIVHLLIDDVLERPLDEHLPLEPNGARHIDAEDLGATRTKHVLPGVLQAIQRCRGWHVCDQESLGVPALEAVIPLMESRRGSGLLCDDEPV